MHRYLALALAVLALGTSLPAQAQWKGKGEVGFVFARGNSETDTANVKLDTAYGPVRLDENRQAIANIYVTEVARRADGSLYNRPLKVIPNVNQTLGQPKDAFVARGVPSRDNPSCP